MAHIGQRSGSGPGPTDASAARIASADRLSREVRPLAVDAGAPPSEELM